MASRYAAVFPISEVINWFFHSRGQRYEEIPHSYQMMLFWAGLRGAVGVALAAGIKGENADALRTTVLVVVVLTVIVFGGTTGRMLEVLGIRVGVEDDDASSDEEVEGWTTREGDISLQMGTRRYAGQNGQGLYGDDEETAYGSANEGGYYQGRLNNPRGRGRALPRQQSSATFSTEDESDEEPLPQGYGDRCDADAETAGNPSGRQGMIFRDGQWFTALDERYLIPLFSNSVTARRHHAKKARRKVSSNTHRVESAAGGTPVGGSLEIPREDEGYPSEDAGSENGKNKQPSGSGRAFG
jgi:sodium/hydrogen exchanger-like protein 6/7